MADPKIKMVYVAAFDILFVVFMLISFAPLIHSAPIFSGV